MTLNTPDNPNADREGLPLLASEKSVFAPPADIGIVVSAARKIRPRYWLSLVVIAVAVLVIERAGDKIEHALIVSSVYESGHLYLLDGN